MMMAASCCGDVFVAEGTGRLVGVEGKMNAALYRDILELATEHSGPQAEVKVYLSTGQCPKAHSQDNKGVILYAQ